MTCSTELGALLPALSCFSGAEIAMVSNRPREL
jgi:hypothetical protein